MRGAGVKPETFARGGALVAALAILAGPAAAGNLTAPPGAPFWMQAGALALLWSHIGGGAVGIASGAVTLATRKGSSAHRAAGKVFFWAMLAAYVIAACVSPFIDTGQRPNFIAAVMALYLLLSGWQAGHVRRAGEGWTAWAGLAAAALILAMGLLFMRMGAMSPTGTVDGAPPQAFIVFTAAGAFALAGEIHAIARKGLTGAARIVRHLWRMCFSLFIASGSFFLGQQRVMPEAWRGSVWLTLAALMPLILLAYWLVRIRFPGWAGRPRRAA
ncbi:MAG: hypothetical protein R3B98_02985 [Hyphomonas sp.]